MAKKEGVIKFDPIPIRRELRKFPDIKELNNWRNILHIRELIGKNSELYNGDAYGNLSQRLSDEELPQNKRSFVITGSGTSGLDYFMEKFYSIVWEYYPETNEVFIQEGRIKASSESMTHGAVYDLDNKIRYVFHVHSHKIWIASQRLGIPMTNNKAVYGTPEMAAEAERIYSKAKRKGIFAMGGHKDGIISFGKTADDAGFVLLNYLRKAKGLLNQK